MLFADINPGFPALMDFSEDGWEDAQLLGRLSLWYYRSIFLKKTCGSFICAIKGKNEPQKFGTHHKTLSQHVWTA